MRIPVSAHFSWNASCALNEGLLYIVLIYDLKKHLRYSLKIEIEEHLREKWRFTTEKTVELWSYKKIEIVAVKINDVRVDFNIAKAEMNQ